MTIKCVPNLKKIILMYYSINKKMNPICLLLIVKIFFVVYQSVNVNEKMIIIETRKIENFWNEAIFCFIKVWSSAGHLI